jgi:hypothetical protein
MLMRVKLMGLKLNKFYIERGGREGFELYWKQITFETDFVLV